MAIRLMSLRSVPEDELQEIRQLLDNNNISYYETPASNWLISAGAIWITDKDQLPQAQTLLSAYQHQRSQQAREKYHDRRQKGEQQSVIDRILDNPLQFIAYLIIILFVLYVSLMPFVDFGQ